MQKVLITDDVHPLLITQLSEAGYVCDYQPAISLAAVQVGIPDYVGLIINSKIIVDKKLLDAATRLRFVARLGSGMEIVDRVYAAAKGVAVFSSPQGNNNAVAEHALGMLLALANNLLRADRQVRGFEWQREQNRGWELKGKTIGLIGFGHTGTAFAKKLSGMEMSILAHDKYIAPDTQRYPYVQAADVSTVQSEADIISFHLPLTAETHHYADADFWAACKKGVIVINTSRGQVVETRALLQGLQSGQLGGACIDVFENEKPATFTHDEKALYSALYALPNVVLTPHIAGWTHESKALLAALLVKQILAMPPI